MRLPPFLARTTLALGMALAGAAQAELPAEELGQVTLPFPPEPHRAYVVDVEFENMIATRVTVIDPDNKRMLGMLSTGGMAPMVPAHDQKTLYTADTYWSRYVRGTRTDMLTAWDSSTLSPLWEVEIPPKRTNSITERYALNTSSDDRFVYIYNFTPSTSVTVVDVQARKAVNDMESFLKELRTEFTLRIVNRPGEASGVWRKPEINPQGRNDYLIVEAVAPDGRVLPRAIRSEETGVTSTVTKWGVRVSRDVYQRVLADKRADGIITENVVGEKHRGDLDIDYKMPVLGGTITKW